MDRIPAVITIGAASQDIFLIGKVLAAKRDVRTRDFVEQFPLGAKLELDGVHYDTGGGATNAAVTFARQGLRVKFAGKIGRDPGGAEVVAALHREQVSTEFVVYDTGEQTSHSTLLLAPNGERTILNYRGASHRLEATDWAIRSWRADWLYISSLAGNFDLLKRLLHQANRHGIKVALNPGHGELEQPRALRRLLPLVTVLAANREEYEQLFGLAEPELLIRRAIEACPMAVLTDGPDGSWAADEHQLYRAGQFKRVKVVDRTGAGDAFCSGFVAGLINGWEVPAALSLASANSTAVVQVIGAKPGILKHWKVKPMKVKTEAL